MVRLRWASRPEAAVIASEDAGFAEHSGVEWDAIEKAWERNQRAGLAAPNSSERRQRRRPAAAPAEPPPRARPRWSAARPSPSSWRRTCSCQGERTAVLRKGQEFAITFMLEALLSKQRILEIYLNQRRVGRRPVRRRPRRATTSHVDARRLGPMQAARLAVMLPAPKRFERRPGLGLRADPRRHHRRAHGAVQPPELNCPPARIA